MLRLFLIAIPILVPSSTLFSQGQFTSLSTGLELIGSRIYLNLDGVGFPEFKPSMQISCNGSAAVQHAQYLSIKNNTHCTVYLNAYESNGIEYESYDNAHIQFVVEYGANTIQMGDIHRQSGWYAKRFLPDINFKLEVQGDARLVVTDATPILGNYLQADIAEDPGQTDPGQDPVDDSGGTDSAAGVSIQSLPPPTCTQSTGQCTDGSCLSCQLSLVQQSGEVTGTVGLLYGSTVLSSQRNSVSADLTNPAKVSMIGEKNDSKIRDYSLSGLELSSDQKTLQFKSSGVSDEDKFCFELNSETLGTVCCSGPPRVVQTQKINAKATCMNCGFDSAYVDISVNQTLQGSAAHYDYRMCGSVLVGGCCDYATRQSLETGRRRLALRKLSCH